MPIRYLRPHDENCTCADPVTSKMEILFEFQGSRCVLNPQSSQAVVDLVSAELKKFNEEAIILCGSVDVEAWMITTRCRLMPHHVFATCCKNSLTNGVST